MRLLLLLAALALSLAGCQSWLDAHDRADPRSYTPAPGYPCGPARECCYDAADGGPEHLVGDCPGGTMCGGVAPEHRGCPAGECCPVGDGEYGARRRVPMHATTDSGS